jgi:hypothetical protein
MLGLLMVVGTRILDVVHDDCETPGTELLVQSAASYNLRLSPERAFNPWRTAGTSGENTA